MVSLIRLLIFLLVFAFFTSSIWANRDVSMNKIIPNPDKIPYKMEAHGIQRIDNYYWMRDDTRKNKKVINHLKKENRYLEAWFSDGEDLRKELFNEIVKRIPKKEDSVPVKMGSFEYFRRYKPGNEYPIFVRRSSKNSTEEIILDVNKLALGFEFFQVANFSISPSENIIAFAQDTSGRREYEIIFRDIDSGLNLSDSLKRTSGDMAWSRDGKDFFYVERHPETLLPSKLFKHILGENQENDILVYEERDPTFYISVGNTRSKKYIEINISSSTSSEVRLIESSKPNMDPKIFHPRQKNHLYSIEDDNDRFLILTNWKAKNFRLMESTLDNSASRSQWKELIPHDPKIFIQSFLTFPSKIALRQRAQGLNEIIILDTKGKQPRKLKFKDPAYSLHFSANPEYNSNKLYISYSSMRVPDSVYSINLNTLRKTLLKQVDVKGKYLKSNYSVRRLNLKARDGAMVPVSLIYRKDKFIKGSNPLFLYGYGSYGHSIDAGFSSSRISLLDRGFVFAIAHVRGGQELGRDWYEDGKMLRKKNTFFDFIDVTKGLIELGFGSPNRVYAGGGSAGGLLMGAIANMEPELYKGIISNVPFVDVVTTMFDSSIPLTTGEYEEWGNPSKKEEFDYIFSYSPYDNIDRLPYPAILVTAGLWDSQVQYYEPAKYVSKLRDYSVSDNPIILKMNLDAGHSGVSGRFASLQEVAMEYAFLLRIDKKVE